MGNDDPLGVKAELEARRVNAQKESEKRFAEEQRRQRVRLETQDVVRKLIRVLNGAGNPGTRSFGLLRPKGWVLSERYDGPDNGGGRLISLVLTTTGDTYCHTHEPTGKKTWHHIPIDHFNVDPTIVAHLVAEHDLNWD